MTTLAELVQQLNELVYMEGRLDAQTYNDTLEGVEGAFEVKAEKVVFAIKALKRRAELMREQTRRFRERTQAVDDNVEYLREYLKHSLTAIGKRKLETPAFTIRLQPATKCTITDESAIPSQLQRVQTEPDKTAITKSIKAGEPVPGAELTIEDVLYIIAGDDSGEP